MSNLVASFAIVDDGVVYKALVDDEESSEMFVVTLIAGSIRNLRCLSQAAFGTISISDPTFQLYYQQEPVSGYTEPVAATVVTAGPSQTVEADYLLNTTALIPGATYQGVFQQARPGGIIDIISVNIVIQPAY